MWWIRPFLLGLLAGAVASALIMVLGLWLLKTVAP